MRHEFDGRHNPDKLFAAHDSTKLKLHHSFSVQKGVRFSLGFGAV